MATFLSARSGEHRVLERCQILDGDMKIAYESQVGGVRTGATWDSWGQVGTTLHGY